MIPVHINFAGDRHAIWRCVIAHQYTVIHPFEHIYTKNVGEQDKKSMPSLLACWTPLYDFCAKKKWFHCAGKEFLLVKNSIRKIPHTN